MTNIRDFAAAKADHRRIVMVTAYDAWTARLLSDADVDCLLVGDSAMMVMHGHADTLEATLELMVMHTRAVVRGAPGKFIVADMPFISTRKGLGCAMDTAAGLLRAGAHGVKVEGVRGHLATIEHMVESGIPVMGHLGLLPQTVRALGGYTVQARDRLAADRLREEAALLESAGAFAIVLECIPHALAREVSASLRIPTIGIGAGAGCDGQVLVLHDLLGFNPEFRPRFARAFVDGAALVKQGVERYATAVRDGNFPAGTESFK
jgi:3-methyl-2-oxobutanoate hydroxymethyltransferase